MKQYKRHINKTDKHNYDSYEEYSSDSYDYQDDNDIDEKEIKLWYKKEYLPHLERQNKINEIMDEKNNDPPLVSNWPQSLEDMEDDYNWNGSLDSLSFILGNRI